MLIDVPQLLHVVPQRLLGVSETVLRAEGLPGSEARGVALGPVPDVYPMRTRPAQGYQALGVARLTIGYAPGRIPIETLSLACPSPWLRACLGIASIAGRRRTVRPRRMHWRSTNSAENPLE